MRKNSFLGTLVIILVFGFIGCDTGNGINEPIFTVTIGALNNGTITASPTKGFVGTEITLTVTPDNNYRLRVSTLKYGITQIDETTFRFNLPAENVTVTAEFQSILIGTWEIIEPYIGKITFFEDGIWAWGMGHVDDGYTWKGTWSTHNDYTIILIGTHGGNISFPPELLNEIEELPTPENFLGRILTSKTIGIAWTANPPPDLIWESPNVEIFRLME